RLAFSRRYEREGRESFVRGRVVTVSCHTVTTGVAGSTGPSPARSVSRSVSTTNRLRTRRRTGQLRARHRAAAGLDPPREVAGVGAPDSRPAFDDWRPEVFIYPRERAPAWICKAAYALRFRPPPRGTPGREGPCRSAPGPRVVLRPEAWHNCDH